MSFQNKIIVVTGGAKGIGKTICEAFRKEGATVCCIDLLPNAYYVGDLSKESTLLDFSQKVISDYKRIDYLINNTDIPNTQYNRMYFAADFLVIITP